MKNVRIGKYNYLTVSKTVDFGLYLDGGDVDKGGWGNILLPSRYVPDNTNIGDCICVFVYLDSEDRIIATTQKPKACIEEFAFLRVVDINSKGVFLDFGLSKDLLVPYAQQSKRMHLGKYYIVYLYQDEKTDRIVASTKLGRFLDKTTANYSSAKKITGMVMAKTDLGYKVIIENSHSGMLYHNEIFTPLSIGQKVDVFVKKIRSDGKIDLRLASINKKQLTDLENIILDKLEINQGKLKLGDKTPPKEIYQEFSVSKKVFKRAISSLYKKKLIIINNEYISIP